MNGREMLALGFVIAVAVGCCVGAAALASAAAGFVFNIIKAMG